MRDQSLIVYEQCKANNKIKQVKNTMSFIFCHTVLKELRLKLEVELICLKNNYCLNEDSFLKNHFFIWYINKLLQEDVRS